MRKDIILRKIQEDGENILIKGNSFLIDYKSLNLRPKAIFTEVPFICNPDGVIIEESFIDWWRLVKKLIMDTYDILDDNGCLCLPLPHVYKDRIKDEITEIFGEGSLVMEKQFVEHDIDRVTTVNIWAKNKDTFKLNEYDESIYEVYENPEFTFNCMNICSKEAYDDHKDIVELIDNNIMNQIKPNRFNREIVKSITNEGDLILDLFGGSASISVEAYKLDRKFVTVDVNDIMISAAKRRFNINNIKYTEYIMEVKA